MFTGIFILDLFFWVLGFVFLVWALMYVICWLISRLPSNKRIYRGPPRRRRPSDSTWNLKPTDERGRIRNMPLISRLLLGGD